MASKNRTVRTFVTLVPDYLRTKCERYESSLQRCLQVMCCMENLAIFDVSQPDVVEFFINVRELLKSCEGQSSGLGWKTVEMVKHLIEDPKILEFVCQLEFVPILSNYLHSKLDPEKTVLLLSVLEPLTEGITVERSGLWLGGLLKNITQAILEKSDYTLPHLLAVLSNFCSENYVVVNELQRESRSDELLQLLMQLQATDPLVQLHAAQVVFCLFALGSLNEALLGNYVDTVTQLLLMGAKNGNLKVIQRCGSLLMWMSRDRLIVEMIHASKFQEIFRDTLEALVPVLVESSSAVTTNSVLLFMARLLRTQLISNKKFTEAFIPPLIPLLYNPTLTDSLLELLADLLKSSGLTNNSVVLSGESLEKLFSKVVEQVDQFHDAGCRKSCHALAHALQILQKLYKISPSNSRVTSSLKPETFIRIVSSFLVLSEPDDKQQKSQSKADSSIMLSHPVSAMARFGLDAMTVVVETLTLLSQIASCARDGDWLQHYSYLLGEFSVQQCLASSILHGDCQLKQATLALVCTLGFSTDSVTGLSQALYQLSSIASGLTNTDNASPINVPSPTSQSLLHWTLPPAQSHKIDKLLHKMQTQDHLWEGLAKCELLELMELQLERRKREEHRLRMDLDCVQQEMNAMKISRLQIQAENDRMMAIVLAKSELMQNKEAENRGLSRKMEHMQQQLVKDKATWEKEREKMAGEKKKLEQTHQEMTSQMQSQLDAAKKQIASLISKNEELDAELEEAKKTGLGYKAMAERREKKLEKQGQDLQDSLAQGESLRKSLSKKEKEVEDKDREITTLKQNLKKTEIMRQDVETRLLEAEKSGQETKEKLIKLEKIQEFIFELSSGKKKIFEEK